MKEGKKKHFIRGSSAAYLDDLEKPRNGHDVSTPDLQRKVNTWLLRHGHTDAGKAGEDRNQGPEGGSDRNGHPELGGLQIKCPKSSHTTKKHYLNEIFGLLYGMWAWLRGPLSQKVCCTTTCGQTEIGRRKNRFIILSSQPVLGHLQKCPESQLRGGIWASALMSRPVSIRNHWKATRTKLDTRIRTPRKCPEVPFAPKQHML
jgi:hypothetical protein